MGNGKTLAMTRAGYLDFLAGRLIISNYKLNFINDDMINNLSKYCLEIVKKFPSDMQGNEYNKLFNRELIRMQNNIKYMTLKEMTDFILNTDFNDYPKGITLLVDEIDKMLNSIGSKNEKVKFITKMQSQTRKRKTNIYYTTQRDRNLHLRSRILAEYKFICVKIHKDLYINEGIFDVCYKSDCDRDHLIYCYLYSNTNYNFLIDVNQFCKLYDTNELIDEED